MRQLPFIAVEGPIGVGKTSLSERLATHFNYRLLKEIVEENPFLSKFYDDIEEWSFQTEMFFLCNRYKQLEDIEKKYLAKGEAVVADYHITKNMIFAKRTLTNTQLKKYEKIYQILTEDMPKPNIMIYLDASLDTLLARIQHRGRELEKHIQASYLQQLASDYQHVMNEFESLHPDIPVIRLNGDTVDFVRNDDDLRAIIKLVENYVQKGEFMI